MNVKIITENKEIIIPGEIFAEYLQKAKILVFGEYFVYSFPYEQNFEKFELSDSKEYSYIFTYYPEHKFWKLEEWYEKA